MFIDAATAITPTVGDSSTRVATTDFVNSFAGNPLIDVTYANLDLGIDDTGVGAFLNVFGGGTGQTEGGEIRVYMSADHDTFADFYRIDVVTDRFRIGRQGFEDFCIDINGDTLIERNLKIAASKNLSIGGVNILSDAAGTTTLENIDAIDATTKSTFESAITTLSNLTTVGALDSGSITSNFGSINNGSSAITTTGTISGGTITDGTASLTSGALTGLTSLTVDNVIVNGNDISTSTGNLTLTPVAGSAVVIDGGASFDGSVLTGLTALTSTAITGTLQTAAQTNITSLGTLTNLTVDDITLNGTIANIAATSASYRINSDTFFGRSNSSGDLSNVDTAGDLVIRASAGDLVYAARTASGTHIWTTGFPDTTKMALSSTGDLTLSGTVDGVDIAALKTDVDGFPDELKNLTTAEIQQLENINTTTISIAQWGFVGGADQALKTTDSPTFAAGTFTGDLTVDTNTLFVDASTNQVFIGAVSGLGMLHVAGDIFTGGNNARLRLMRTTGANFIDFEDSNVLNIRSINTDDTNANVRATYDTSGNYLLGTITSPTGTATKAMIFGDNAGDPTPGSNTAGIYGKDVSGTVELFAVDEAGNTTQLSPHDPNTGKYYYNSVNKKTGRKVNIDMEGFIKDYDKRFSTFFFKENKPLGI